MKQALSLLVICTAHVAWPEPRAELLRVNATMKLVMVHISGSRTIKLAGSGATFDSFASLDTFRDRKRSDPDRFTSENEDYLLRKPVF